MARQTKIVFFSGNVAAMPILNRGEPAFCVDTGQLFIGNGVSNIPIGGARLPAGDYGDITVSTDGLTWTINDHVVGTDKIAQMISTRLLGRKTTGIGDVEVITIEDAIAFAANFITFNKIQQITQGGILGRKTAGTGDIELLSAGEVLNLLGFSVGDLLIGRTAGWTQLNVGPVRSQLEATTVGGGTEPRWIAKGVACVREQQTSGTNAGACAAGTWQTRVLNTTAYDRGVGLSLSSNQFTLPAGDYHIRARCPAVNCGFHKSRLRDITVPGTSGIGASAYANNTQTMEINAWLDALVSIASSHAFELQHMTQFAVATFGLGAATSMDTEVYSEVFIDRLA